MKLIIIILGIWIIGVIGLYLLTSFFNNIYGNKTKKLDIIIWPITIIRRIFFK